MVMDSECTARRRHRDRDSSKERKMKATLKRYRTDYNINDGSQGWCIVMCCFLVNVVVMGFLKSLGILTIALRKAFNVSQADVAVLVSITTCLNCVAGPLACYLVTKFTARTIAFVGTSLVSIGLVLSWWATSIQFLYITIGVFVGFGSGLTYSPGVILVGYYFVKNRGMANGIVVSGSPVGGMIMPFTLNFLIYFLDCRGALLILGGLMLNAVVCTLSYRPYKNVPAIPILIVSVENVRAKKTKGSLHIPQTEGHLYNVDSKRSGRHLCKNTHLSDSEDSSGPEFIVDEESTQRSRPRDARLTTTSGSVILHTLNENYGRNRKPHVGRKSSLSRPKFWPASQLTTTPGTQSKSNEELDAIVSGIGQNIQSKASQTEIHTDLKSKQDAQKTMHTHPFASTLRSNVGSGHAKKSSRIQTSSLVASAGTVSSNFSRASTHPKPGNFATELGSQSSTLKNKKTVPESTKRAEVNSSSAKKLSPYVLSLDHSCVIMWSNDDVQIPPVESILHAEPLGPEPTKKSVADQTSFTDDQTPNGNGNEHIHTNGATGDFKVPATLKKKGCCSRILHWIKASPLNTPIYLILLFSNAATAIATTNVLLLIPALGEYRGLSQAEYSTVYLVISVSDLSSRLLGAFISDRGLVSYKTLFAFGLFFAGTSSIIIAFCDDFLKLSCICAIFGLSSGFHIGIYGALLADIVGVRLLHVGYAFSMILNGSLQFTFIYLSGRILSSNPDAFTGLYILYGIILISGASLWIIPLIFVNTFKIPSSEEKIQAENKVEENKLLPTESDLVEVNEKEQKQNSELDKIRRNRMARKGMRNKGSGAAMSTMSLFEQ